MSTLVLCLDGPMQAWGASSRFTKRETRTEPTKSGVIGLLAAAQGIRRTDSIEHLLELSFGVRIDQEGSLMSDFQVARSLDGKKTMPLSRKYYLADAIFVAAVEGEPSLVDGLADAIRRPVYPLFLGRRSCPPSRPIYLAVNDMPLKEALEQTPWQVSDRKKRKESRAVVLRAVADGSVNSGTTIRDVPVSFDPRRREYGWRTVDEFRVTIDNPHGQLAHDPMSLVGGA